MANNTKFISFPLTMPPPSFVSSVVEVFEKHADVIATRDAGNGLKSDEILAVLRTDLLALKFQVEMGKTHEQKIRRPVFFGEQGRPTLQYQVDAYQAEWKCGLEVESARAVGGNAIYRDLIQALVMVEVDHLCLAVPITYVYGQKKTKNRGFDLASDVAHAIYGHTRMRMPYGLTVIGF